MSKTEERLRELSEWMDLIPEDKQEGIVFGVKMLAALYDTNTGERRPV